MILNMEKILMIDDDQQLTKLVSQYFAQFQLELSAVHLPNEALSLIKQQKFSAIILDVMMPQMDGFELCKKIRQFSTVPIIMLTARGDTTDKVIGLELGVDDYLAKPFDSRELVARVKALIRRSQKQLINQKLAALDLLIDIPNRECYLGQDKIDLSTLEFELLTTFMKNPGRKLSRDEIMSQLNGSDWDAIQRGIDVAISRLRQKLNDSAKQPRFIKTIWGDGYQFLPTVEEIL